MSYRLFNSIEFERYLWWKIVNLDRIFYSSRLIFQASISDFRNMYAIEIYECLIVLEPDIWRYVIKKVLLKTLQNSQENTCAGAFIPATLLKERLLHRCFLVNFAKFLKIPFLQNTSKWLLLYYRYLRVYFAYFC